MHELFRAQAVHQAKAYRVLLDAWNDQIPEGLFVPFVEALVHDGLWLTKFPLHRVPTYGVERLDALDKARQTSGPTPALVAEALALRPLVDADVLRLVLAFGDEGLGQRFELFYRGRPYQKPIWQYLTAWFDRSAAHRALLGRPQSMLDTVFG